MLILIDLDGTILNSVHPTWKPYKDGKENYCIERFLDRLTYIEGAKTFIKEQQQKGNSVLIVSDSHPKYVEPISKCLGLDCVSLADKPNSRNLFSYLDTHPKYKKMVESKDCVFIGDTVLDIELGRRIEVPTIWILPYYITKDIKNDIDKVGDVMASLKMGPTYCAKSFAEIQQILDDPINHLYAIESSFVGGQSVRSIKYAQNRFSDGSYVALRCLARQESGSCDKYASADKYYLMSNPNRSADLVMNLAKGVSSFISQSVVLNEGWDYITYLTDKKTTVPQNKMKEIFDLIETNIPKVQLLKWADTVNGSLRSRNLYNDRKDFLEKFLSVDALGKDETESLEEGDKINIKGKNIIVVDDQLTTSATAWHVIHKLKDKGARNILFIALFQMALEVKSSFKCPVCGKEMLIKIRHSDGCKFYSCVPPKYGGDGCGNKENF